MSTSEAERLEALWAGQFGDDYVERNLRAYEERGPFWASLLSAVRPSSVLEVGSNIGGNLQWVTKHVAPEHVAGVDVNKKALHQLRTRLPGVRAEWSTAKELPFDDRSFDLVFTMGVLIHQPEQSLPVVMDEMVRVADKYVMCGEYFDEETVEIGYRGHSGALFRRDYGGLFAMRFEGTLRLRLTGHLDAEDGFDDLTWWLFERV
jgi:pseudaminic acid biosynthesis-associated methylase